jgi:hypothetical protein
MLLGALCIAFLAGIPPGSAFSGPLFLVGTGHDENRVFGYVWALALMPLIIAYPTWRRKITAIISAFGIAIWFASGALIRIAVDW